MQKTAELLQKTEISAKKAEKAAIDAAAKIRKRIFYRNLASYGLLAVFFVSLLLLSEYRYGIVPQEVYYIALPFFLTATGIVCVGLSGFDRQRTVFQKHIFSVVLSGFLILCSIVLLLYSKATISRGEIPFGAAPHKVGLYLDRSLLVFGILQTAVYVSSLIRGIRLKKGNIMECSISLTGIFLLLSYHTLLREMSDMAGFEHILFQSTAVLLLTGLIFAVFFYFLSEKGSFYKENEVQ